MKCKTCGADLSENQTQCPICGTTVSQSAPPPIEAEAVVTVTEPVQPVVVTPEMARRKKVKTWKIVVECLFAVILVGFLTLPWLKGHVVPQTLGEIKTDEQLLELLTMGYITKNFSVVKDITVWVKSVKTIQGYDGEITEKFISVSLFTVLIAVATVVYLIKSLKRIANVAMDKPESALPIVSRGRRKTEPVSRLLVNITMLSKWAFALIAFGFLGRIFTVLSESGEVPMLTNANGDTISSMYVFDSSYLLHWSGVSFCAWLLLTVIVVYVILYLYVETIERSMKADVLRKTAE